MDVVKELEVDKKVLKRIEMICRFACVKPIIQNGSIINIKGSNIAYGMNSKLKEKQKGKNRDITSYERKLFNERVKGLKQEISNIQNEVSNLEDNKETINKQISNINKDKEEIVDKIDKKEK